MAGGVRSALAALDAGVAETVGERFQEVVQAVADVAGGEAGAAADFVVFQVVVIFEAEEVAVGGGEFGEEQAHHADGFVLAELLDGEGGVVGRGLGGGVRGKFGFLRVIAEVVEGEVAEAAVEPGAGIFDLAPNLVEAEKRFLDEFLGDVAAADEAEGEAEEAAFLGFEDGG